MYDLFAFAIGVRVVAFIVFIACVYGGWIKCLDALLMLGHFCLGAKKIPPHLSR